MKIRENTITGLTLDSLDLFTVAYGLRGISNAIECLADYTGDEDANIIRDLNFAAVLLAQINREILGLVADPNALDDALDDTPAPVPVTLPRSLAATAIRLAAWTEFRTASNGELPEGVTVEDLRQLFRCIERQDVLPASTPSEEARHAH